MEKLSHAYIISSADSALCMKKAKELAQKMLCSGYGEKPCGVCRDCRKVSENVHPDLMYISRPLDEKGNKKRNIQVDQIRDMGSDAAILPNEADGKVYIIEDADTMNEQAQNAALKLFEEPPKGVSFILCAENPQRMLITVRSRCVEINCNAEAVQDENLLALAKDFVGCLHKNNEAKLTSWCFAHEKLELRELPQFLECVKSVLVEELRRSENRQSVMENIRLIERCIEYTVVNTNVKHIFGLLAVRSVPITEEVN